MLCRRLSCENEFKRLPKPLFHYGTSILNFGFEELPNLTSKYFLRIFFKALFMSFLCLNDGIFAKSEKYIYQQFTIAIPHCHFYISHVSMYFQKNQPYSKWNDQEMALEELILYVHLVAGFIKSMKCTFHRSDFGWIIKK